MANPDIPFPRLTQVLDSSAIGLIGYDPQRQVLLVGFVQSQSLWTYSDVPRSVYADLCSARSPGQYFNSHVRGRYVATRLSPAPRRVVLTG